MSSTKFVFFCRLENQDCYPSLWLDEAFLTSPLKPLKRICRDLTESKNSMSSARFVFFVLIWKTRWPPWPLIGWDIFDFFSEPLNRIIRNLTGSKNSTSSTKFLFVGPIWKPRWPPWPLICWDIFDYSSGTTETNLMKIDKKHVLNVLYQFCDFWADQKTKITALAILSGKVAHCSQVHDMWPFWLLVKKIL